MNCALLFLMFWPQPAFPERPQMIADLIGTIGRSGRVIETAPASQRLADPLKDLAPGAPPLLAFRYFDGADRHRFGKLDLMVDDAGH